MGLAGSLDSTEINSVEISEECCDFHLFRRRALPPSRLAVGTKRLRYCYARLETRKRFSQIPLPGHQKLSGHWAKARAICVIRST